MIIQRGLSLEILMALRTYVTEVEMLFFVVNYRHFVCQEISCAHQTLIAVYQKRMDFTFARLRREYIYFAIFKQKIFQTHLVFIECRTTLRMIFQCTNGSKWKMKNSFGWAFMQCTCKCNSVVVKSDDSVHSGHLIDIFKPDSSIFWEKNGT